MIIFKSTHAWKCVKLRLKKKKSQRIMNSLRVEGVFWRIVNQIDPDFMMAQYSYDPYVCAHASSTTDYRKMKTAGFNPCRC